MKLTYDQVKKVAKLANLELSEVQEEEYTKQLSRILDYIDQLKKVDTRNVEPTFNVMGLSNIWRDDEVIPGLSQDEALQNTTEKNDGLFITKGVFEE